MINWRTSPEDINLPFKRASVFEMAVKIAMLWIWAINLHEAGSECLFGSISGSLYCKLSQFSFEMFRFRQMSSNSSRKQDWSSYLLYFLSAKVCTIYRVSQKKNTGLKSQFHKYMSLFWTISYRTILDTLDSFGLFGPFYTILFVYLVHNCFMDLWT